MIMSPEDAHATLRSALVWDNHACAPLRPHDTKFLPVLERYRAIGVNVLGINIGFGTDGIEEHVRMAAQFRRWIAERPEQYRLIRTVDDIAQARAANQLALFFDIEGMNALGEQASMVELYYDIGVRWMLIAYNDANPAGGGCHDAEDPGLSDFGRDAIDEMNRVGMLPCCSHTGYRTARETIAHSSGPVIFSHSNARALWNHPRNIPDELIRACADKGGVIGVNGIGLFLGERHRTVSAIAQHIDHVIQVGGEDHVGLGLDYVFDRAELDEGIAKMAAMFPAEHGYDSGMRLTPPEEMPELVQELSAMGHGISRIEKVLGGNMMRLARDCWR